MKKSLLGILLLSSSMNMLPAMNNHIGFKRGRDHTNFTPSKRQKNNPEPLIFAAPHVLSLSELNAKINQLQNPNERAVSALKYAHEYLHKTNYITLVNELNTIPEGFLKMALRMTHFWSCINPKNMSLEEGIFNKKEFVTKVLYLCINWANVKKICGNAEPELNLSYLPRLLTIEQDLEYILPLIEIAFEHKIKKLNLSGNRMTRIPSSLKHLTELKYVNVAGNNIQNWEDFSTLTGLQINLGEEHQPKKRIDNKSFYGCGYSRHHHWFDGY